MLSGNKAYLITNTVTVIIFKNCTGKKTGRKCTNMLVMAALGWWDYFPDFGNIVALFYMEK